MAFSLHTHCPCRVLCRVHTRLTTVPRIWHKHYGAYSFCAVFLFRFINRNRNRRVLKERLSFERNNFHGNKMAHSLISKRKGKKYEKNHTRTKFEKKMRVAVSIDFLFSPTALSSSFFLVRLRTCIHGYQQKWRVAAVLTAVLFGGKSGEKGCGTRRGIICCAFCGATLTKVSVQLRQKIVFQSARENKEINENVDAPA